jgi:hypothetical protein
MIDSDDILRCPGDYCALRMRCKRFTTRGPGHSECADSPVEPGGRACKFFLEDPENAGAPDASLRAADQPPRVKKRLAQARRARDEKPRRLSERRYEKVSRYLKPERPKLRLVKDEE